MDTYVCGRLFFYLYVFTVLGIKKAKYCGSARRGTEHAHACDAVNAWRSCFGRTWPHVMGDT
jgi:hypothetical protein